MKNTDKEGLGLGLYICNEIVKATDGKITVISELGKGSTFTLHLPQIAAATVLQNTQTFSVN